MNDEPKPQAAQGDPPPPEPVIQTDDVAKNWVVGTTALCVLAGMGGHAALWYGYYRGQTSNPVDGWTWQPIIGLSITAVAFIAFGGFYVASRRARTAIAASFLLTFLLSFSYALTISGFADLKTAGAEALFNDFRNICFAIIAAYFTSETVITTSKIVQVGRSEGSSPLDIKTADRDLAPHPHRA